MKKTNKKKSKENTYKEIMEDVIDMLKTARNDLTKTKKVSVKFSRFSKKLIENSNNIKNKHKDVYQDYLILQLAEICDSVSSASENYEDKKDSDPGQSILAIAELVQGSVELSNNLIKTVETIKELPHEIKAEPGAQEVNSRFGELAYEIYYSALTLGDAAGFYNDKAYAFKWPSFKSCGCNVKSANPIQLETDVIYTSVENGSVVNDDEIEESYKKLLTVLLKLFLLIKLLERFLTGMLAYFDEYYYQACNQDCTGPSGSVISVTRTNSYSSQDGTSTPKADADVSLCCSSICFVVFTEWDVETVPVTGITVGRAMGQGRERAAARLAGGRAALATLIRSVRATPPACP